MRYNGFDCTLSPIIGLFGHKVRFPFIPSRRIGLCFFLTHLFLNSITHLKNWTACSVRCTLSPSSVGDCSYTHHPMATLVLFNDWELYKYAKVFSSNLFRIFFEFFLKTAEKKIRHPAIFGTLVFQYPIWPFSLFR